MCGLDDLNLGVKKEKKGFNQIYLVGSPNGSLLKPVSNPLEVVHPLKIVLKMPPPWALVTDRVGEGHLVRPCGAHLSTNGNIPLVLEGY